jgi:hypothetical protein
MVGVYGFALGFHEVSIGGLSWWSASIRKLRSLRFIS